MAKNASPALSELVPVRELQSRVAAVFRTQGSLDWELRTHRADYVRAGALFELAGRWFAHPPTFERVALAIAARKAAVRIGGNASTT